MILNCFINDVLYIKTDGRCIAYLEVAIFFFIAIGGWIPMGNVALQLEMQS